MEMLGAEFIKWWYQNREEGGINAFYFMCSEMHLYSTFWAIWRYKWLQQYFQK